MGSDVSAEQRLQGMQRAWPRPAAAALVWISPSEVGAIQPGGGLVRAAGARAPGFGTTYEGASPRSWLSLPGPCPVVMMCVMGPPQPHAAFQPHCGELPRIFGRFRFRRGRHTAQVIAPFPGRFRRGPRARRG